MKAIRDKVTLNQLIDIYRGSASKKCLKYSTLNAYGRGRDKTKGDVERLLQNMCVQSLLQQYCHSNPMGYVSSYVKIGREAKQLETNQAKFLLTVDNSSSQDNDFSEGTKERKGRKRKSEEGIAPLRSIKRQTKPATIKVEEDEFDDLYEPTEDETNEFSENDCDNIENVECRKKENIRNLKKNQIIQKYQVECFNALKKARQGLCVKNQCQSNNVATDLVLTEIAKEMPASLTELSKIRGITDRQMVSYGSDLLKIVNQCKNSH